MAIVGAIYTLVGAWLVTGFAKRSGQPGTQFSPVSILKPLHGAERSLAENIDSFCRQDYDADVQIVFGVQDPADPAAAIARDCPCHHSELVVDGSVHGRNRKISNLMNMAPAAKNDILIISDSDICVGPGWLKCVVGALQQPDVGAVTCLYTGRPAAGPWSKLGAMGITYQFLPNAVVGAGLGLAHPCSGSTIAMTRATLERIGGLARFADELADDYEIGRAIRALGMTVAIAPLLVEHVCVERSGREWFRHELRWARTVRQIDPLGYAGSIVTQPIPLALLAILLGMGRLEVWALIAAFVSRLFLKVATDRATKALSGHVWLLPMRDILGFGVFIVSFFGTTVSWRGTQLDARQRALLPS